MNAEDGSIDKIDTIVYADTNKGGIFMETDEHMTESSDWETFLNNLNSFSKDLHADGREAEYLTERDSL